MLLALVIIPLYNMVERLKLFLLTKMEGFWCARLKPLRWLTTWSKIFGRLGEQSGGKVTAYAGIGMRPRLRALVSSCDGLDFVSRVQDL